MKALSCLLFLFLVFELACTHSSETALEPAQMEIHYTKYGGWINTSRLDISNDGKMNAYLISQATGETMDSASTTLNQTQQDELAGLFRDFSSYSSQYEPATYYTDQDFHRIIYDNGIRIDTVSVYMPDKAPIPDRLNKIIHELETLWGEAFHN